MSTQYPFWKSNFENIYKTPSRMTDWYLVFGNHDYKGNTQAEIDHSKISRMWRITAEYYKGDGYPDIAKRATAKQIAWLKNILANSTEKWKHVFGHHAVFSASKKHGDTKELIQKLRPIFEKCDVQYYFCRHDHDFRLLKEKNGKTSYIVTGTGGETRPASTDSLSVFGKSVPGFSPLSLYADSISVCFIDTAGAVEYMTSRNYRTSY